jgi:hypothetical protein
MGSNGRSQFAVFRLWIGCFGCVEHTYVFHNKRFPDHGFSMALRISLRSLVVDWIVFQAGP